MSTADRLATEAAHAARIRALSTDPDVIALHVERIRVQVDRLMWAGIVLGLAFTMTNVQTFAAAGAPAWSLAWCAAWALDPMVSLVLLAVLRAEQVTARWQVRTGPWVRRARWFTLAATYVLNTWASWADGVPSLVVLHSVPPLVVFVAAEAVTGLREALTDAVHRAGAPAARTEPNPGAGPDLPELDLPELDLLELDLPELDLPDPVAPTAGSPGEDRVAALAVPPTAGPRLGPHQTPVDAGEQADESEDLNQDQDEAVPADSRVRELVELLAAGVPVTGPQAAALHETSERTGRRLLADARAHLDANPRTAVAAAAAGGGRAVPGLHLVRPLT